MTHAQEANANFKEFVGKCIQEAQTFNPSSMNQDEIRNMLQGLVAEKNGHTVNAVLGKNIVKKGDKYVLAGRNKLPNKTELRETMQLVKRFNHKVETFYLKCLGCEQSRDPLGNITVPEKCNKKAVQNKILPAMLHSLDEEDALVVAGMGEKLRYHENRNIIIIIFIILVGSFGLIVAIRWLLSRVTTDTDTFDHPADIPVDYDEQYVPVVEDTNIGIPEPPDEDVTSTEAEVSITDGVV